MMTFSEIPAGIVDNLVRHAATHGDITPFTARAQIAKVLLSAAESRKDQVVLGGDTFNLRYEKDCILFSPLYGFTPCGRISISRLQMEVELDGTVG